MARVKGTAVRASVAFLKERLGEEGWKGLLAALPEEDREIVGGPVLQSSWYEVSLLYRLMDAARPRVAAPPGKSMAWEMGRYSAEYGLKTIYRIFFKVADPHFIIRKASQVFSNYYDCGKMENVVSDPHSAILRLSGFDQPRADFCDRVQGWMERTLELSGGKAVAMSHPKCLARGDDCCEYKGRWS
jgi:hypothetical protein